MLFKKLFRLLVVTGAVSGTTVAASGCAAQAASQKQGSADAGTAQDGGSKAQDQGGGSQGW